MSKDGMSRDGRKMSPMHVTLKEGVIFFFFLYYVVFDFYLLRETKTVNEKHRLLAIKDQTILIWKVVILGKPFFHDSLLFHEGNV